MNIKDQHSSSIIYFVLTGQILADNANIIEELKKQPNRFSLLWHLTDKMCNLGEFIQNEVKRQPKGVSTLITTVNGGLIGIIGKRVYNERKVSLNTKVESYVKVYKTPIGLEEFLEDLSK